MKTRKALFYLPEEGRNVCLATLAQFLTGLSIEGYQVHATSAVLEGMSTIGNSIAQPIPAEDKVFSDYDVCVLDYQDPEAEKILKLFPSGMLVIDCCMIECDIFYDVAMSLLSLDQDSVIIGTDRKVSEYLYMFIDAQRNLIERMVQHVPALKVIEEEIDRCVEYAKAKGEVLFSELYMSHLIKVGKTGSSPYLSGLYDEANSKT